MRWAQGVIEALPIINFIAVIWPIPDFIRSFSLQFVSSNMHYFGDIEPRDVIKQTKVLTPWWLIPNFIRSFSLQFVSSNMHYYGDIDPRDVIKQTQVLTPWWMIPFQLFCCNFGATHAIHHFVVKEPFYIRQMTSKTAHKVMKE